MQKLIRKDYLSKENTNCMKFLFAVAIVFCHIFAYNPFGKGIGIGAIITAFGYLSVSVFLFFSGYGLTVQYMSKGDRCFEGYFKKRILPIYIIQILLILFYTVFKLIIKYAVSYKTIIQSFLFGNTIVQYGWYLQMIILFYIIYYLAFRKTTAKNGIIKLCVALVIYTVLCVTLKLPSNWYEASFSFLLGAIWALKKEKIDSKMNVLHKYVFTFILSLIVFVCSFVLGNSGILPIYFKILVKMFSAVFFVVCVLFLVMKIRIKYKTLEFAGKYYFEIYFMQGFVILLFNETIVINNDLLRYIICYASVFALAILVKPVVSCINKMCSGIKA